MRRPIAQISTAHSISDAWADSTDQYRSPIPDASAQYHTSHSAYSHALAQYAHPIPDAWADTLA
eukprot:2808404-Rhodomonas_salina.1